MMATEVAHGRRKGSIKKVEKGIVSSAPASLSLDQLREVTVLNKDDWNRIQYQLNKKRIEEEQRNSALKEKEEQRNKSRNMVKNWTNTIQGQRHVRLEARRLREEAKEEERKAIDLEEEMHQKQRRQEILAKARTQQYYETDRVKSFHTALRLTEVLKEREAQLELTKLKAHASKGEDKEWAEKARREYEESILEDQKLAEKLKEAGRNARSKLRNQIKENYKLKLMEKEEAKIEGKELELLGQEYQAELRQLESIKKEEQRQLASKYKTQIEAKKKLDEIRQMQMDREDDECRIFAAAKRKLAAMRAEKENEIYGEKMNKLEKIKEKLSAELKKKMDDEDQRISNAIHERTEKETRDDAEKHAKLVQTFREMERDRLDQMQRAEEIKKEKLREEERMMKAREVADKLFRESQGVKDYELRREAEEVTRTNLQFKADRLEKERKARERELQDWHETQKQQQLEEDQFLEYAGKVINHCARHKRNLYPLRTAVAASTSGSGHYTSDKAHRLLPHYESEAAKEAKELVTNNEDTNNRMGFIY